MKCSKGLFEQIEDAVMYKRVITLKEFKKALKAQELSMGQKKKYKQVD